MIQPILNSIRSHFPESVPLSTPKRNRFKNSLFHFALPGLKVVEVLVNDDDEELSITTFKLPSQTVLNDFLEQHAKSGVATSIFNCPSTIMYFGLRGDMFAPVTINNVDVSGVYGLIDVDEVADMIDD